MKTWTLVVVAMALCPFVARAQSSCSQIVGSSCTLAQPIMLTNVTGLNFGTILTGASAGTITLSTLGVASPTITTGGPAAYGGTSQHIQPTAATFYVAGEPGYCYSITTPPTARLTGPGAAMTVTLGKPTAQTVSGHSASGLLNSSGTASKIASNGTSAGYDAWAIGATLQVNAGQAAGHYVGTFQEEVQYQ